MNRKLLVVVIVAAVLALVAGAAVGRNLISSEAPPPRAEVVRFDDDVANVSVAYPGSWRLLPVPTQDPDLALRVARDNSAGMSMRVSEVGFEGVTTKTLHIVRKFTDSLLADDKRVRLPETAQAVNLGEVPGYRYRYTFGSGTSAGVHDHYFLFKDKYMIQLVFETRTQERMTELTAEFDRIARSFKREAA